MVAKASDRDYKTFGETVGGRAFPDAAEAKLDDMLDIQVLVKDVAFKQMKFGEVAIILFATPDAVEVDYTMLVGGEVVVRKVKEAKEKRLLPLLGTIVRNEVYYDIV